MSVGASCKVLSTIASKILDRRLIDVLQLLWYCAVVQSKA